MRVLVLGAAGMLGSAFIQFLSKSQASKSNIFSVVRNKESLPPSAISFLSHCTHVLEADLTSSLDVDAVLDKVSPDAVINCAGIIKQKASFASLKDMILVNSWLPIYLAESCRKKNIRLVNFSTDCVFSGKSGQYTEDSLSDCIDLYGKSKYMGESASDIWGVTLRTSIIGEELYGFKSLFSWVKRSRDQAVKGYSSAFFSGWPTIYVADFVSQYILNGDVANGMYNFSSSRISKYDLICIINDVYNFGLQIVPDDTLKIDRSLSSSRLQSQTAFEVPSWHAMISRMKSNSYFPN